MKKYLKRRATLDILPLYQTCRKRYTCLGGHTFSTDSKSLRFDGSNGGKRQVVNKTHPLNCPSQDKVRLPNFF